MLEGFIAIGAETQINPVQKVSVSADLVPDSQRRHGD